ncbi:MAG TPA: GNAT family N-acetyltransferase [Pyrinomonadaceae bacterium]
MAINQQNAVLVGLSAELKPQFLEMAADYQSAGENRHDAGVEDFDAYLERLAMYAAGVNLPAEHVPSSEFYLLGDGKLIGRAGLRHSLNRELEIIGGHIGYDVRPSERGKGFGTLILRLALEKARGINLKKVLLTCDADNAASARIIEKNGGRLDKQMIYEKTGKLISRYRIEL